MIYSRQDLLSLFADVLDAPVLHSDKFEFIETSDVWFDEASTLCPKCKKNKRQLLRINKVWACVPCHGIKNSNQVWTDRRLVFRMVNDLLSYFGEVTSEKLFDSTLVQAFIRFTHIDTNPRAYILMLQFVRLALNKEMGARNIIDYLAEAEAKLKLERERFDPRYKYGQSKPKHEQHKPKSDTEAGKPSILGEPVPVSGETGTQAGQDTGKN